MAAPKKDKTSQNTVFVYANLPSGQAFRLPKGQTVTINGHPISQLTGPNGEKLPAGQYGVTEVDAEQWAEVERIYGEMTVMKSGLIFAAASREIGDDMAVERQGLRHGLEPIDPDTTTTKPDTEAAAQQGK